LHAFIFSKPHQHFKKILIMSLKIAIMDTTIPPLFYSPCLILKIHHASCNHPAIFGTL